MRASRFPSRLWVLLCVAIVAFAARVTWAQEPSPQEVAALNAIHVCVKPSWLNKDTSYWSYAAGNTPVKLTIPKFKERTAGHNTYVYDPWAPPENTALLPAP